LLGVEEEKEKTLTTRQKWEKYGKRSGDPASKQVATQEPAITRTSHLGENSAH